MPEFKQVYEWRHIATDPLHIKRENRYAVVRLSDGVVMSEHIWSCDAVNEAHRLNVAAGACPTCGGKGSIIVGYFETGDGESPEGGDCPDCGGTGIANGHAVSTSALPTSGRG